MAIRRITISVPEETAALIRKAAGKEPVSAWVTEVIEEHLDTAVLERQWQEFCRDAAPKPSDLRRADAIFERLTGRSRRRGAA